ncbi:hypothetical protein [Sciscionella sediminilitoris]|uniref:hypothetical protein n=1 Tax=Sciscionella sediminilitoris TaxID=1445613 RepID=UPI00068CA00D|nr:hypothetical protein [Sciscionella sp. SE31]
MAYTGEQIYDMWSAADVSKLHPSWQAASELNTKLPQRSEQIQRFANALDSIWQGSAASSANSAGARIASAYLQVGDQVDVVQDLTKKQMDSAQQLQRGVQPVPPAPDPAKMACYPGQPPGEAQKAVDQFEAHRSASENNVNRYRDFVGYSQYNANGMPHFVDSQPSGSGDGGSGGGGQAGGSGGSRAGGGAHSLGAGGSGGGSTAGGSGGLSTGSPAAHGAGAPDSAGAPGHSAPQHSSPGQPAPGSPPPGSLHTSNAVPTELPTNGPGYGSPGSGYGGSHPGGSTGLGGMPMGGMGALGGMGGGDSSGSARGYGSGAGGSEAQGPRSGAAAPRGVLGETEQSAPRGGAGSGRGGMPMGGAGRGGKGGEDQEHETASYLVSEEHGDQIVGELPPTVPPVLGE